MLAAAGVLSVALHLGTINNELTYDDHAAIERNPNTERPVDLWAHVTSGFWGPGYEQRDAAWRPFTTLTLAWNRAVHGIRPGGYHLVNLALHATAVAFIGLLGHAWGLARPYALLAAVLFAVHPLHVDAIAPGVGRADLLLGSFGFAALYAWERERVGLALGGLALALLAKEMAAMLALVLVWRELGRSSSAGRWGHRWWLPLAVLAVWLAARVAVLGALGNAQPSPLENPLVGQNWATRVWTAGDLYARSLQLFVAPVRLLADYSYATLLPVAGPTARSVVGLLLLAGTGAAAAATVRRRAPLSMAVVLWLAPWLLVSHLGPLLPMIFAERVLYLPSGGLCLLCGVGLGALSGRQVARPLAGAAVVVVLLWAARSTVRVGDWRDDAALHDKTVADAPQNVKALVNSALQQASHGQRDRALATVARALAVGDHLPLPHLVAANLYTSAGAAEPAARHLERAAALHPDTARMAAVRCAFDARFAPKRALRSCVRATAVPFALADSWMLLAIARDRAGDPVGAERAFVQAMAREPNPGVELVYNYGIFLARQGRLGGAHALLLRAQELAPGRDNVARALARVERALWAVEGRPRP
jgi:protein O-mannosyl-transferase